MATQVTHIATADKLFDSCFSKFSKKDFYIGTTFPDIRYLGDVTRDQTHFYDLNLQNILKEENSFMAGLKFHCLVDLVREDFVSKEGIYSLFSTSDSKYTVPKLLEDELFYNKLKNWEEIIDFYNNILPEEETYPIPLHNIERWHKNLQGYFKHSPNDESRLKHATDLGMAPDRVNELNRALAELRTKPQAIEVAEDFYNNLEGLLEDWS
jgi:hypothetical protein